jgi:hypothetical protein
LAVVEVAAASFESTFRQLGSLAERHGLIVSVHRPASSVGDGVRVAVRVPRARTVREAHGVVAELLAWLRNDTIPLELVGEPGAPDAAR